MSTSNLIKTLFFVYFLTSLTLSCSKFEDGPMFSLISVKNRISREWKIEYVVNLNSGIKHSAEFDSWLLKINKDGTFTNKVVYNLQESNYNGIWELTSKNQLKFEYNNTSGKINEFYTISRLTKKEFWIKNQMQEIYYFSE